jgi:hypothetical protein
MQKKNWILLVCIAISLAISLFLLGSGSSASSITPEEPTCCEQASPAECVEKQKNNGELAPENLSHQFISIIAPF